MAARFFAFVLLSYKRNLFIQILIEYPASPEDYWGLFMAA